jgi:F0F1-type ATP synthase assembly protein I
MSTETSGHIAATEYNARIQAEKDKKIKRIKDSIDNIAVLVTFIMAGVAVGVWLGVKIASRTL